MVSSVTILQKNFNGIASIGIVSLATDRYVLVPNVPKPNRNVAKAFGIRGGLEGVIIIDKKGRIRYKDFTDDHSSSSLIIRELKGI